MKPKYILAAVGGVIVLGAGVYTFSAQPNQNNSRPAVSVKGQAQNQVQPTKQASNVAPAAQGNGSYQSYSKAKVASAAKKGTVVLFFHAPWCSTCQEANKNFENSQPPKGLTVLKVDYDSSTDLKQKYGVTYQHTFVEVDSKGNLVKKWSGSYTYDELEGQLG